MQKNLGVGFIFLLQFENSIHKNDIKRCDSLDQSKAYFIFLTRVCLNTWIRICLNCNADMDISIQFLFIEEAIVLTHCAPQQQGYFP